MRVARRYVISGRVQGVGFRFFTEAAASREGVHGWVRNLTDGPVEAVEAVEVVAEGDAEAMERFERSIRQGPRGARVDHVEVDVTVPDGRAVGFTIK
ncbi:MAG: acylphosphatase [Acidobacteriia bacterium]|nr:acylphosphatase [Terriglobia bacterium]